MEKSAEAFRTISEVAELLGTPAHVLRFWESRFPQVRPVKRAGGRRYYRPADVALLGGIRRLLHDEGMTIRGVQKILKEQGVRHVAGLGWDEPATPTDPGLTGAQDATQPTAAQMAAAAQAVLPDSQDQIAPVLDAADATPQSPAPDLWAATDSPDPAAAGAMLQPDPDDPAPPMPRARAPAETAPAKATDGWPQDTLFSGLTAPAPGTEPAPGAEPEPETSAEAEPGAEAPIALDVAPDAPAPAVVQPFPGEPQPAPESQPLPPPALPPGRPLAARLRALGPAAVQAPGARAALGGAARRLMALRDRLAAPPAQP
ncbi:MerR family transcriptional regulator [Phaeovulum sp. NW3]|uniref:MerR family transcriptional regulator n=1 Tax=Phaeovulum sp. NW3 TaxID=2934933 RepID=UPI002022140F|nr:MerR family transcriptional regulator [Phaeovulum sp. NW3]MCL7465403.1 MerR family transcriptional regulator [Phaeovulum sp. NW3]